MKKIFIGILSAILLVLSVGCNQFNTSSNDSVVDGESGNVNGAEITNNVIGDFEQDLKTPKKCKVFNAEIKDIEPDLMNKLLFNGTAEKTVDSESDRISFNTGEKHGICSPNSFIFYTDSGTKFDDCVSYYMNNPNETYMDSTTDLSFASRDNAVNDVMDFLDRLGLDPKKVVVKNMYSVKKEGFDYYKDFLSKTAAKENDTKISTQAEAVSKISSEDFYFIDFSFIENDIPVYSGDPYFYGAGDNDTFAGTVLSIVYTPRGVEYVIAMFLYQMNDVISDSDIISFSEAQSLLQKKYDNMFVDNEITFYDAELLYLPLPQNTLNERFENFVVRPYYAFYGTQSVVIDGEDYSSEFNVFFDAVTGKEL